MWLGTAVRVIATPAIRVLFRVREHGREHMPREGAAVVAGNHRSYMDPVILWCVSPRFVHFMAKKDLFERGFVAWALPRLWAFPVDRSGADRAALVQADAFLKAGELVGIFPEGARQTENGLGEARGGAAFVALRAMVPVVPVAVVGTEKVWPKGQKLPKLRRVTVVYGRPISPEEFPEGSRKERVEALTNLIMGRISEELETAKKVH
ncbi:MAG: lysophospholipid acyltransferase family protein [Coriobacteriia bacterium]